MADQMRKWKPADEEIAATRSGKSMCSGKKTGFFLTVPVNCFLII